MNKKLYLSVVIAAVLSGCGSSSDGGNSGGDSGGGDTSPSLYDAPTGQLAIDMSNVTVQDSSQSVTDVCNTEDLTVFETEDFIVGVGNEAEAPYYDQDLRYAAQMTQVALNELLITTALTKAELDLENNKWTACFNNNKSGNGTGAIEAFYFGPSAFDESGLKLAKHELFHTIQSELLQKENAYTHLPFWFQEATAEYFAQQGLEIISHRELSLFSDALAEDNTLVDSSYGVDDYTHDQAIRVAKPEYSSDLYTIYETSLAYLMELDSGLNDDSIIQLIRDSYSSNPFSTPDYTTRDQFHEAIVDLENAGDLVLPNSYNYVDLKTTDVFNELILDEWMEGGGAQYSAGFIAPENVTIEKLFICADTSDENTCYEAFVSEEQDTYFYATASIPDGDYSVYAIDKADVYSYGPIAQTVINFELGDLDFSAASECTTGMCAD